MHHPYVTDANDLSEAELEEKIFKLTKIYHQTPNLELKQQVVLALDTYKLSLEERRAEAKKLQNNTQQGENDLDNLINVS